mmetsp:Transcript_2159/g.5094  ORF Transcript_2159/g.5094 Transcript_2159/m.5094 type:complete len:139 (+) Transcript_2159:867-1283(+)
MLSLLSRRTLFVSCTQYTTWLRTMASATSVSTGPVQTRIEGKLREAFAPTHLEVENESHKHNVPRNSETHFKVTVVSKRFEGLRVLDRHRAVNDLLADELASGVHALSIRAKTPEQFGALPIDQRSHQTPNCLGGSKK